jgi:hypothetical protein
MAGKHPEYVQELPGHASTSITLDACSHVVAGTDDGLGNAMDAALRALLRRVAATGDFVSPGCGEIRINKPRRP